MCKPASDIDLMGKDFNCENKGYGIFLPASKAFVRKATVCRGDYRNTNRLEYGRF